MPIPLESEISFYDPGQGIRRCKHCGDVYLHGHAEQHLALYTTWRERIANRLGRKWWAVAGFAVGFALAALLFAGCGSSDPATPSPQFIPSIATTPVVINGQVWCGSKDGHLIDCAGNPIVLPTK